MARLIVDEPTNAMSQEGLPDMAQILEALRFQMDMLSESTTRLEAVSNQLKPITIENKVPLQKTIEENSVVGHYWRIVERLGNRNEELRQLTYHLEKVIGV